MITDAVINSKVTELKELKMARAGLDEKITALENAVKSAMEQRNLTVFVGENAKVTWNEVASTRFDSAAFKRDYPDEYTRYIKTSVTRRFVVA